MKLYYSPGACSLAVHITLRELALPFEAIAVNLATHTLPDGSSYYDIAPRGYVPLLQLDDGSRHTEGTALLQYLADGDAKQALIGAPGTPRRLAVTQWLGFIATELHKAFSPWLWHKETADSTRTAMRAKLDRHFAELDAHLAQNAFLAGEYSVADAYAYAIVNWAHFLSIPLTRYSALQAYLERIKARPAVQAALRAEGLLH